MSEPNGINNSSRTALKPLLYALLLAAGIGIGMRVNQSSKDKFSQIFDIIQRDYVDSTRTDVLAESTIEYLLSQLDPHSSYIAPQYSEINEQQIRGNYEGLGIEYIAFRDTPCVYNVYAGSPAEKAGIKPGDRLLMAGNVKLTDSLTFKEIRSAMTGEANSSIALKIYRRNTNSYLNFTVSRGNIVLNSSEVYYMVSNTLGYIQIERFSNNTHKQFLAALEQLRKQGMKDLLIDLRNNGGGLLYEAVAIANEFLQKDDIISYTSGYRRKRHDFIADGQGTFKDGKLVLLINHNTASASEILAGALQDNDRAVIIGNRSFGKGLVQEPFKLSDGSTLRLTISRYYTPSGRSIQKSYDKNLEKYRNEIFRRDNLKDTLNPVLDSSIKKEFFTRNGRLLTSGGGIRPDITLRDTISDSTEIEQMMPGLFYSRMFDIYLMDYMSKDLEYARQHYKDVMSFQMRYSVDNKEVIRFIKVASAIPYLRQLKYSIKTADIIKKHLKAAMAYRLYGEKGKSQIINREEGVFSKTFEVLKNYNRILNIGVKKSRKFDY